MAADVRPAIPARRSSPPSAIARRVSHRRSHVLVLALPDGVESVRKPPVSRPGNCHHKLPYGPRRAAFFRRGRRGKGGHRSASQPWRVERGYERGYKGYIQKRDVISKYAADTPPPGRLIRPPSLSFADLQKAPVAQRLPGHLIICTPSPPFATIRVSGVDAAPRSAVGVDAKEQTWHGPPSTGCRTGV